MRSPRIPGLAPAALMLAALATGTFLFAHAPAVRAECGTASGATPCPTPSPIPSPTVPPGAYISLDVSAGGPQTKITITGSRFAPNQQITPYWDQPNRELGPGYLFADGNGSFTAVVGPWPGDSPGIHRICVSITYPATAGASTCATFTLEAPAPPSPSPSPSPTESPSPSATPAPVTSEAPTPTPVAASLSGFDVISRPPFVFLPLAGALGIALSLGYWVVSMVRRPRQRLLPTAAVMHRAMRPDYSAGFGTAPPAPALDAEPSAWDEPVTTHAPEPPPAPEASAPTTPPEPELPDVEWGDTSEWGTGTGDWGFPEPPPDDNPEAPQPPD